MIIGTAGHIDHGKSALVRCLTGTDPDRLKEEKARGITIDLGFAYWPRPDGPIVGFVDVPGHEDLVHNMLAGATGIDFVLLVVAADDGIMPQTREHMAIMNLLGLQRGLVALNKADLVGPERLAAVTAEIEVELAGSSLADAEILPVSALTGMGIEALVTRLDAARASAVQRGRDGAFRMAVDRVFTLTGLGTVVTGTIISGAVRLDDQVRLSPSGIDARVRSIHAQNRPVEVASASQRCALALAGTNVNKETVRRGDMALEPRLHAPTARLDVRLDVLKAEQRPLGQWMPVRFHHGAAEVGGRIVVLGDDPLAPGTSGLAQLVLEAPIAAAAGDRFIVRDTSARRTIGGGTILDLRGPERRRHTPERKAELAALSHSDPAMALTELLAGPRGFADLEAFARDRALSAAALGKLEHGLVALPIAGQRIAMAADVWHRLETAIGAAVDQHHATHPDQIGLPMEALRRQVAARMPFSILSAAVQRLVAAGTHTLDRGAIRRPGHGATLPPQDAALWIRIRPMLAGGERFRPPRVRDIAGVVGRDEAVVRRLMQLTAKRGDIVEIAKDHYFLATTVSELASIAKQLDAAGGSAGLSAAQFRDQLDNGRKVAIQILEFFDARGFTIRRGDLRRINPHRASMFDIAGAHSYSTGER